MLIRLLFSSIQAFLLLGLLLPTLARATPQGGPASSPSPTANASAPKLEVAPGSPRASLSAYLDLCRKGHYQAAARFLHLAEAQKGRGPELARRLKSVLDRHVWFELERISNDPGLALQKLELARITSGGVERPVQLERLSDHQPPWLFDQETVAMVDEWFVALHHHWLLAHLPAPLLQAGPRELLIWQWLALPLLVAAAWAAGLLCSRLSRRLLGRITAGASSGWDEALIARVGPPITLGWMLLFTYIAVPSLGLYAPAAQFVESVIKALSLAAVFWLLARSVDVAQQLIARSPWALEHPASRSLLPLGTRVGKVVVLAMGAVAMLSQLGYPVASLVAGLGIGGLAVALAAQKTVENLFGAFSIGADQPFREGDFVRVDNFVGTVEAIGLRSTRFRTLDRTLISIPNGKLAEMRTETFAARDRIRLECFIGLTYGTRAEQLSKVIAGFKRVLHEHPKIWPDTVVVAFQAFADSALTIEVMAWFQTTDFNEFRGIREEVLLAFMHVVEDAGCSFAFPTRTVHLVNDAPLAISPSGQAAAKAVS
jgi:MscS family membrane protein